MREIRTVAIVGYGLIGGSLGRALKKYTDLTVLAISRNAEVLRDVEKTGAADACGDATLLSQADMVVLALPPQVTVSYLEAHAAEMQPGTLVTEVCGIKRCVVEPCEKLCLEHGLCFLGGHPMAGKEHSGFYNSTPDLFVQSYYILTPTAQTDPAALDFMKGLAEKIKCKGVTVTTPEHHDQMIAFTSQLPHVLASSYVRSPEAREHEGYSAGSYRDVSRVASVDENLWCHLFLKNKDFLCEEIQGLVNHLLDYKEAMEQNDEERLRQLVLIGRQIKEGLPQ